ncbi:TOM1-like protein 2 isoform X3 [Tachypleus tridentatus]|uniref:TOM1-like protein 2 isoform X3 n=1 Tax=Tachypleus tridentatus TaxID=6853 RepID=UPI003FD2F49F
MAAILAQFGGNPFATPVGQKIEQATDAALASESWALNMEICDLINETDEGPKDAIKAVRKRLQQNAGKNYTVVMYTLTVLETCVKNCGKRLHLLVTQKDFIMDLVKLIGPKNDPPTVVQEKVLSLIQSWADAFLKNPEMQGVVQVYHDLKQKGIEFPLTDLDTVAPIYTPQRSVPLHQSEHHQPQSEVKEPPHLTDPPPQEPPVHQMNPIQSLSSVSLSSEQLAKLRSELDVVEGNMKVFGEMLTEMTPEKGCTSDWELLQELQQTCRAMQSRVVELVDRVGNEEVTSELLRINDELNNLFLRYERFEKKKTTVGQNQPIQTQSKQGNAADDNSLRDFRENGVINNENIEAHLAGMNLGSTNATSAVVQIKTVSASNQLQNEKRAETNDFDKCAQSHNVSCKYPKTSGSPGAENSDVNWTGDSLSSHSYSKVRPQQLHKEQDFDEMKRWLQDKPSKDKGDQPSITSSEFDHFLAERAAKAEQLPPVMVGDEIRTTSTTNSAGRRTMGREEEENSFFAL